MNPRLSAIYDRLDRADDNIELIKGFLRDFHASDAYGFAIQYDPNDERGVHIAGAVVPPDLRLFTLTGDVLHELRSSLDHLAWQLVRVNDGDRLTKPASRCWERRQRQTRRG